MGLPRVLYIASSHGRELDYHMHRVCPDIPVYGVWISGVKIKAMYEHVKYNIDSIVDYAPTHCFILLLHNDICFSMVHNPEPMKVPEAIFNYIKLVDFLRARLPETVFIATCPLPRVPKNRFSALMCTQYNHLAVRAGECLADRRYGLRTIFMDQFWKNVKRDYAANPKYLKSVDGLHLTPTAKRIVATKWLCACHEW